MLTDILPLDAVGHLSLADVVHTPVMTISQCFVANPTRFVVAFMFGTGLRPKELRLADLKDLDTNRWVFKVMHPKKVRGAIVGAELAIYADTRVHLADFLAARERHLLELGIDPASVTALIPSERGKHYSEVGFRNIRIDTFRNAGVKGDFRVLRRTHEQLLMDRLEQRDYKEGSVIEIAAKRLRHSPQTALKHYADLRTRRGQDAAKEAWEAPVVEIRSRKCQTKCRNETNDPL